MADLFDEIREEVSAEKLQKLWQAYGKYVITVAVVTVLGTGVGVWWKGRQQATHMAYAEKLYQAIELKGDNSDKALEMLREVYGSGEPGYEAIAGLEIAALLANKGDIEGASAQYKELAEKRNVSEAVRQMAILYAVYQQVNGSAAPDEEIQEQLQELSREGQPWRFSSREALAIAHWKNGKKDHAIKELTALQEAEGAPGILRKQAEALRAQISGE